MCGGGTIPIEAVLMAKKKMNKKDFAFRRLKIHDEESYLEIEQKLKERAQSGELAKVAGLDISPKHIEGAIQNAMSAGVLNHIAFRRCEVT